MCFFYSRMAVSMYFLRCMQRLVAIASSLENLYSAWRGQFLFLVTPLFIGPTDMRVYALHECTQKLRRTRQSHAYIFVLEECYKYAAFPISSYGDTCGATHVH